MLFLPEFKITFGCYICRVINGNRGSGKESKESCGYSGVGLFLRLFHIPEFSEHFLVVALLFFLIKGFSMSEEVTIELLL